jgi:hypothetical protein
MLLKVRKWCPNRKKKKINKNKNKKKLKKSSPWCSFFLENLIVVFQLVKKLRHFMRAKEAHCTLHKSSPVVPILNQTNPDFYY